MQFVRWGGICEMEWNLQKRVHLTKLRASHEIESISRKWNFSRRAPFSKKTKQGEHMFASTLSADRCGAARPSAKAALSFELYVADGDGSACARVCDLLHQAI